MLTFPTGKYRLILYYPGHTFHFPRATGKRNSRPLLSYSISRYFSEAFTFVYLAQWNTQVIHHMTVTILNLENAQMGDN